MTKPEKLNWRKAMQAELLRLGATMLRGPQTYNQGDTEEWNLPTSAGDCAVTLDTWSRERKFCPTIFARYKDDERPAVALHVTGRNYWGQPKVNTKDNLHLGSEHNLPECVEY